MILWFQTTHIFSRCCVLLWMGKLGEAVTETAASLWCCSGILICRRSSPGAEYSSFTSILCLCIVFLLLSCKAYLFFFTGSKSLERGSNLIFLFIHYLCFTPANYSFGTKLNRTLNHLSLQEREFKWVNLPERYSGGPLPYGEHLLYSIEWRQIQKSTSVNALFISVLICNVWRDWDRLIQVLNASIKKITLSELYFSLNLSHFDSHL